MKHRITLGFTVVALAAGTTACGEVDQRICDDVPKVERAISGTDIRGDFKQELLDDVGERASEANCPGYEDAGDD